MKTWMKVVLGIVAGFAALLALIFWLTGDITKTGDDFFAAVQNDDMDTAYALLSEDFQTGTSKEELKAYLEANALDDVKETSWGSRMMTGGTGELDGTVTTKGGSKIPLKLRLIDSEAGWRINAIEKASAGFKESAGSQSVPPLEKQQQLFRKTFSAYAESLADRSMKKLRDQSSSLFRAQFSLERLDREFGRNFEYAEAYSKLSKMTPIIDSAGFGEDGFLVIEGHYPVKPHPLYIRQSFVFEGIDWKSTGLISRVGQPVS